MHIKNIISLVSLLFLALSVVSTAHADNEWVKLSSGPVLGKSLGTCFDISMLREANKFRMYFSWRPKASIALTESTDGIHWSDPVIVIEPDLKTGWESDINRPAIVKRADGYHLWYTGQADGKSKIGYAFSKDGIHFERKHEPVLVPENPWEKVAVMCPHVIWDGKKKLFRMWYSGGEQYEPDAIGYATSSDGLKWDRLAEPVFASDKTRQWESHKVTACQVLVLNGWYYMFYIGFRDIDHAAIGIAKSRNGISNWIRLPSNPIVSPTPGGWDSDACYKPFAILDGDRWMLWYNGRRGGTEQIGLVTKQGKGLGL